MYRWTWATELDERLAQIAERVAVLRRSRLSRAGLESLRQWFRIHHTFHSNAIEGNTLTLAETRAVVEDGITIAGKSLREHVEAVNLAEAVDWVEDLARAEGPFTERTLLDLHALVMRGIAEKTPGAWRRDSVRISGSDHLPPSGLKVPEEIDRFLRWLNDDAPADPLVRGALAHAAFEHIHPFMDGNGRTGRLLANLILLRGGYPVVVLRKEDRARYYEALRQADAGDATEVLSQFCEAMERSLGEYERIQADWEARAPEVRLLADKPQVAEKEKAVPLELTADEALVLLEFLSRFNAVAHPELFEDPAEERALWNLEALLERVLVAPFRPTNSELLRAARERLRREQ